MPEDGSWLFNPGSEPHSTPGIDSTDFRKLHIPFSALSNGIVFIWVEKEYIYDIVKHFEDQNLLYIESITWVMMDKEREQDVDPHQKDVSKGMCYLPSTFFRKTKRTMLMFRRVPKKKDKDFVPLELRH